MERLNNSMEIQRDQILGSHREGKTEAQPDFPEPDFLWLLPNSM